jgi:aspartate racemase
MKMIGLIGGMSWESTVVYYQLLNRLARQRLGGLHSAKLLLWSFDFAEIEAHQAAGDWEAATDCMLDAARSLEKGGAECIVICTNTMHKMAEDVQDAIDIPLIHIADATATAIKAAGARKPLLLGTRFTMEQDFYKGHLENNHGINVLVPNAEERTSIHEIIYQELCQGEIRSVSKQRYLEIVSNAINAGADGVIFGCTEVGLLIAQDDLDVPAFDTTVLHANAAMDYALS